MHHHFIPWCYVWLAGKRGLGSGTLFLESSGLWTFGGRERFLTVPALDIETDWPFQ